MADWSVIAAFFAAGASVFNVAYTHVVARRLDRRQWTRNDLLPKVLEQLKTGQQLRTKAGLLGMMRASGFEDRPTDQRALLDLSTAYDDRRIELDLLAPDKLRIALQGLNECIERWTHLDGEAISEGEARTAGDFYAARTAVIDAFRSELSPRAMTALQVEIKAWEQRDANHASRGAEEPD